MPESHEPQAGEPEEFKPSTPALTPEFIPVPTSIEKMTDIAIDLVDQNARDEPGQPFKTAIFYAPDNDTGDGKYPSVKINVPKEEVVESFHWRAELTFGNQDPKLSSHVLIKKDGTIEVSNYSDSERHVLDDVQAKNFLTYLEQIKENLIADNIEDK